MHHLCVCRPCCPGWESMHGSNAQTQSGSMMQHTVSLAMEAAASNWSNWCTCRKCDPRLDRHQQSCNDANRHWPNLVATSDHTRSIAKGCDMVFSRRSKTTAVDTMAVCSCLYTQTKLPCLCKPSHNCKVQVKEVAASKSKLQLESALAAAVHACSEIQCHLQEFWSDCMGSMVW